MSLVVPREHCREEVQQFLSFLVCDADDFFRSENGGPQ